MQIFVNIALLSIICNISFANNIPRYDPTWESLDERPLPSWYDEAKVGIFLHWGVYSVPSFGAPGGTSSEWFWAYWRGGNLLHKSFMKQNYPPEFTYQEFAEDFKAEFYEPDKWVKLFEKSGAKYVVLTSKHHDGFTLWPSTYTFGWNAKDVGPHRDILGDLATAVRNSTQLKFGLYYSLYEWYHPLYLSDKRNNFITDTYITNKAYPELVEIVEKYHPEIVWADGDWEASDSYFKSREFLAWLYNDSPVKQTVLANDRWGIDIPCSHGDFYTCADRYNPGVLQPHKWENAMTIDKNSWGFRRNTDLSNYITTHDLLSTMAQTISCGGNILVNVGPTHDGRIDPIFEERLLDMGEWLSINGEAIYASKPWIYQNDTNGYTWYTSKSLTVYAITLEWPKDNKLELHQVFELFNDEKVNVSLLGNSDKLKWKLIDNRVHITFPDKATVSSKWVWVVKMQPMMLSSSNVV